MGEQELVSQAAGMIGPWYPQAASVDGGRLLAEHIAIGPVQRFVAVRLADEKPDHPAHPDQIVARAVGACRHSPTPDPWPSDSSGVNR